MSSTWVPDKGSLVKIQGTYEAAPHMYPDIDDRHFVNVKRGSIGVILDVKTVKMSYDVQVFAKIYVDDQTGWMNTTYMEPVS